MRRATHAKKAISLLNVGSEEEYRAKLKEKHIDHLNEGAMFGGEYQQNLEMYYPEDYGKAIPKDGAWIMVLDTHSLAKSEDRGKSSSIWVRALSFFYAKPIVRNFDADWQVGQKMAQIITKDGDVLLYPHEYNVVQDIYKYYESFGDGINIVWLNEKSEKAVGNPEMLLYIRSRGIGLKNAYKMILGEIRDSNLLYFEAEDNLLEFYNKRIPPKDEILTKEETEVKND